MEPYQYLYLILAITVWLIGYRYFGGRFIRPKWKKAGKLIGYLAISFLLLLWLGHYALIFIIGHQLLGGLGHFIICKKNDIDWVTCQPEEKYIALTEKWAKGNFSKLND
ncbi:MAG: hypothetical protein R6W68_05940 [Ignavibacteriaceae bacterium]